MRARKRVIGTRFSPRPGRAVLDRRGAAAAAQPATAAAYGGGLYGGGLQRIGLCHATPGRGANHGSWCERILLDDAPGSRTGARHLSGCRWCLGRSRDAGAGGGAEAARSQAARLVLAGAPPAWRHLR
jgi:hypothetical protein